MSDSWIKFLPKEPWKGFDVATVENPSNSSEVVIFNKNNVTIVHVYNKSKRSYMAHHTTDLVINVESQKDANSKDEKKQEDKDKKSNDKENDTSKGKDSKGNMNETDKKNQLLVDSFKDFQELTVIKGIKPDSVILFGKQSLEPTHFFYGTFNTKLMKFDKVVSNDTSEKESETDTNLPKYDYSYNAARSISNTKVRFKHLMALNPISMIYLNKYLLICGDTNYTCDKQLTIFELDKNTQYPIRTIIEIPLPNEYKVGEMVRLPLNVDLTHDADKDSNSISNLNSNSNVTKDASLNVNLNGLDVDSKSTTMNKLRLLILGGYLQKFKSSFVQVDISFVEKEIVDENSNVSVVGDEKNGGTAPNIITKPASVDNKTTSNFNGDIKIIHKVSQLKCIFHNIPNGVDQTIFHDEFYAFFGFVIDERYLLIIGGITYAPFFDKQPYLVYLDLIDKTWNVCGLSDYDSNESIEKDTSLINITTEKNSIKENSNDKVAKDDMSDSDDKKNSNKSVSQTITKSKIMLPSVSTCNRFDCHGVLMTNEKCILVFNGYTHDTTTRVTQSFELILDQSIEWKVERQIWIAFEKNGDNDECLIQNLPKDIVHHILNYCRCLRLFHAH